MPRSQPDLERDVIVRHTAGERGYGGRWAVFLGSQKRTELDDQHRALVFARLLADLQQRPVWVCYESEEQLVPIDHAQLRGCSCC
jgi:hypothetical protein